MESLSDILKNFQAAPIQAKDLENRKRAILQDPLIRSLRERHPDLDERTLALNINKLYQYVAEYKNCSNCPGLDQCPNDFGGHYTKLTVEHAAESVQLYDHKVSCKKWLARQTRDAASRRVRSFYVDEQALRQGYDVNEMMSSDPGRTKSVMKVMQYIVHTRESGLQPRGLYLAGNFGTGKTFLMGYMLHELAKIGLSGVIVYMPDFVEDLKAMFQEPLRLKDTIDLMKQCDLLIFDDIGAENTNPWVRDHVLGSILNYRMNRKPTFYTSNYDLQALEQHFSFTNKDGDEEHKGRRIMERIRPFVDVIVVSGANRRDKKTAPSDGL